jgi:hypothetical protein
MSIDRRMAGRLCLDTTQELGSCRGLNGHLSCNILSWDPLGSRPKQKSAKSAETDWPWRDTFKR